ncbi:MAG: glucose 1-dehydrogenase [Gammaproteobacteria bacterium]|nr:glucose 1-dehydrogenase [Gammaproteobacteria bacterium]
MQRFSDMVVLITGGSTGIGRATALAFAREGAKLMIGDIDARAAQTVDEIRAAGGTAMFHRCDVAARAEVDALVGACVHQFGGLDAAFNNAGVLPPPAPLHAVPEHDLDRIIAVDLKGVFFCMQAQIRHFLAHGGGAIVNTASVAGIVADPNMSAYVGAKHAVVGLTRAAAIEYARRNIRVNAIAPGLVATPMTRTWLDDEGFKRAFFEHSPIGRAADPAEIAGTVLHLCSAEASFTNGALFVLDGGQTAH